MQELTSDELRELLAVKMGGISAYQQRNIQKMLNIALARAEAAEMMAGKWLQLVTLRDNLIFELEAERDAAVARAEAAEADLGELRENVLLALGISPLDVQDGLEDSTIMIVVNGLVGENAALREELAEQVARAEAAEGEAAERNLTIERTVNEEVPPNVLVITFGTSITRPQLDSLDVEWSYYSTPVIARERLITAIDAALGSMSDEYGRIMRDPTIWRDAIDGTQEAPAP